MNFIRKFYEAAVAEGGGGAGTEAIEEILSPAAAMAKMGTKSDENSGNQPPVDITPKPKVTEPKTEEEAKPAAKVEEAKPAEEAPKPKVEEAKPEVAKPEEKPVAQTPEKAAPTLQEVLKNEQPAAILKAIGISDEVASLMSDMNEADPKIVGLVQAYKDGTLNNYVRELATDYSKMSSEDVMRHQLREEYPKANDKALEALFKQKVEKVYNLNSDDEDELSEGKLLLDAEADKYRDKFMDNQKKYLYPEKPQPKVDNTPSPEQAQKQLVETYRKNLLEDAYTKDISQSKKLSIAIGDDKPAVLDIDPAGLVDVLSDTKKWGEKWSELDTQQQFMLAAFIDDPNKFLSKIAEHSKTLGGKVVADTIENASEPDKATPAKSEAEPKTKAEAMAKHGTRRDGAEQ